MPRSGFRCVCGQSIYQFGWHVGLWGKGQNKRATWHCACGNAWQFWNAPANAAAACSGQHCVKEFLRRSIVEAATF
jgi:hypothetical protein